MKTMPCLLATAALACACSKSEVPPPPATTPAAAATTTAPTPSTAPAATTVATASGSNLPQECTSYLDKVTACVEKQPGAAAAMKQAMEQTRATWSAMATDKVALANACKTASDAFAQQAAMMKC